MQFVHLLDEVNSSQITFLSITNNFIIFIHKVLYLFFGENFGLLSWKLHCLPILPISAILHSVNLIYYYYYRWVDDCRSHLQMEKKRSCAGCTRFKFAKVQTGEILHRLLQQHNKHRSVKMSLFEKKTVLKNFCNLNRHQSQTKGIKSNKPTYINLH